MLGPILDMKKKMRVPPPPGFSYNSFINCSYTTQFVHHDGPKRKFTKWLHFIDFLQAKIQKHLAFEAEVSAHANAIVVLDNTGTEMIDQDHFASDIIRVSTTPPFYNNIRYKHPAGDKNISILHLYCSMSDLQFSLVLQTHALVL